MVRHPSSVQWLRGSSFCTRASRKEAAQSTPGWRGSDWNSTSPPLMTILYILVGVIAYLLGSIPFGYLLVRIFRGQDIRQSGSGNIGATNVVRSGAKGLGIATLVLDALKGFIAVAIGGMLANVEYPGVQICGNPRMALAMRLMSIAALFAVLGHMFPVWLKFRGGKGVATALG